MKYGAYGVELARRFNIDDAPMRCDSCQDFDGRLLLSRRQVGSHTAFRLSPACASDELENH